VTRVEDVLAALARRLISEAEAREWILEIRAREADA
jgi:hypothetical protein